MCIYIYIHRGAYPIFIISVLLEYIIYICIVWNANKMSALFMYERQNKLCIISRNVFFILLL